MSEIKHKAQADNPTVKAVESLASEVHGAIKSAKDELTGQGKGVSERVDNLESRIDETETAAKTASERLAALPADETEATAKAQAELAERLDRIEAQGTAPRAKAADASPLAGSLADERFASWIKSGMPRGTTTGAIRVKSLSRAPYGAYKAAEVLGDAELGALAIPQYRQQILTLGEPENGLLGAVSRVPSITGDTYKYLRETVKSRDGYVYTESTDAVSGGSSAVSEIVVRLRHRRG